MIRTCEANEDCLFGNTVSRSAIVVARVNGMSMIQAFADRIALYYLVTHGCMYLI